MDGAVTPTATKRRGGGVMRSIGKLGNLLNRTEFVDTAASAEAQTLAIHNTR